MPLEIREDDLTHPATRALVAGHVAEMRAGSAPELVYAYDLERLLARGVTLWSAWDGDALAGVGGLAEIGPGRGELKSFRTHADHLGRGVGRRILRHALAEARARGYASVWLETGTAPSFDAARHLYGSEGFVPCAAFGDYVDNPLSHFMRLDLG
ncbi:GNAT family N-acetyltransferase [Microbacterium excoecariae]|uniref:GNAT family N-acetyltransferase n=1 Tax=Microbacterium excoecariae TaxID=2715210 RepID=UPI0030B86B3C